MAGINSAVLIRLWKRDVGGDLHARLDHLQDIPDKHETARILDILRVLDQYQHYPSRYIQFPRQSVLYDLWQSIVPGGAIPSEL